MPKANLRSTHSYRWREAARDGSPEAVPGSQSFPQLLYMESYIDYQKDTFDM